MFLIKLGKFSWSFFLLPCPGYFTTAKLGKPAWHIGPSSRSPRVGWHLKRGCFGSAPSQRRGWGQDTGAANLFTDALSEVSKSRRLEGSWASLQGAALNTSLQFKTACFPVSWGKCTFFQKSLSQIFWQRGRSTGIDSSSLGQLQSVKERVANIAKCTLVSLQITRLLPFTFHGEEYVWGYLISHLKGKVSSVSSIRYGVCYSFFYS